MKPLHSVMFALVLAALTAGVRNAAGQDLAQSELGISMADAKDLCSYAKDVLYGGENRYSWEEACDGAAPDIAKLRKLKELDFMYKYDAALAAAPGRKKAVLELQGLFNGPEFQAVKDDSDRRASQRVSRCMTKNDCLDVLKEDGELRDIAPPITARTFPAWLPGGESAKLLPFMVIAEDERLRNEKYKELRVPLEEKERKKHCAVEANKAACAQFDKVQKQLGINKETMHRIKGVVDPDEFSRIIGEGRQRMTDAGGGDSAVMAQWSQGAADDPSKPVKPQQKLKVSAPPQTAGQPQQAAEGLTDKAKRLGAAGAAAALAAGGALLAWGKSKLNARDAAKKSAAEVAEEDGAASRSGEFVKQTAEEGLNAEEAGLLSEYRAVKDAMSWQEFVASKTSYGIQSPGMQSLAARVKQGALKP